MKRVLALALLGFGCAHTSQMHASLDGEGRSKTLGVKVTGSLDGARGALSLAIENLAEDPIGIDIDAIRLQGEGGAEGVAPLGHEQAFRSGGTTTHKRVARGAATVPPGASQTLDLDFDGLDGGAPKTLTLFVPSIYRLGIDGQENLRPLKLPLHVEQKAGGVEGAVAENDKKVDGEERTVSGEKFFDPFVEW